MDESVKQARAEVERSRERAEVIREQVVAPLCQAAAHNQFADMIRASLAEGHNGGGAG